MEDILISLVIGLGISLILTFEIWYFSVRHWDKYGELMEASRR